jgi:hypothetical protein
MTSILLVNVVVRATFKYIGARRSFRHFDINVVGAFIHAMIGLIGVPSYNKEKKKKHEIDQR